SLAAMGLVKISSPLDKKNLAVILFVKQQVGREWLEVKFIAGPVHLDDPVLTGRVVNDLNLLKTRIELDAGTAEPAGSLRARLEDRLPAHSNGGVALEIGGELVR